MLKPLSRWTIVCTLVVATTVLIACSSGNPDKLVASAKAFLDKGEVRSAVIELKTALQLKPDLAEARFLLGKGLLEIDDLVGAVVELRKAMDLKHPQSSVVPVLARAMQERGLASDVVTQFASAALDDKAAQASVMTTVALAHAQLGQTAKAEATFNQALEAVPGHVPALVGKARLAAAGGDTDAALKVIDGIVARGAADPDTWVLQGNILAYVKADRAAALAAYRRALGVDARHLGAHVGVISLLLATPDVDGAAAQIAAFKKMRPGNPMVLFYDTQLAYEKRDFKVAKEGILQLLKGAPDHPQVNLLAGAIELVSGSLTVSRSHLAKTLQADPNNVVARRMLAAALLRSGDANKAIEALNPLLEATAPDAVALSLAGEAQMQLGQLDHAAELFAASAKANPKSIEVQTVLARTRLLKGDALGAVADLERIAASDAGSVADLELVNSQLRRRDYSAALKAVDGLERKLPGKPLPMLLRGIAYQGLKDIPQARANFEKALAADATYFPATFNLAALDITDKKPQAAQARFETVLKVQPGHLRALLSLADLKARNGAPKQEVTDLLTTAVRMNPTEATARVSLINNHLINRQNDDALAAAQHADAALPDQPSVLDALGRAQLAAGQHNQAISTYNKILALQPRSVGAHMRIADANLSVKNNDAAIQGLKRAVSAQPNAPILYQRLFVLEMQAGRHAEALKLARDLQKSQPAHSLGFILEGDLLRVQKNNDAALAAYRTALTKAAPTDAATRVHNVLATSAKLTDAEKFASTWMKEHPSDIAFLAYLGDVALLRHDYALAEAQFRRVVELQPSHVAALNNLAWLLVKASKAGAIPYAEQANILQPNQPALMDTMAMALAADKRIDQALELQKKALALAPDSNVIKLGLARLYVQSGQKAAARDLLEPLSKLGESFADHAEVKSLVAGL